MDSSVAAALLLDAGYEVVGLFMVNWHDTAGTLSGDCPWEEDRLLADMVARRLDIPFHTVDLSDEYRRRVVDYMFGEYGRGRTPNPDVMCNREIKFDAFVREARRLGADFVATGHYCRREVAEGPDGEPVYRLLAGADPGKDQSYFLCGLSQEQLSGALFPVGGLLKSEVRRIAAERRLPTASRKDSQGICFVGKVDLPVFLRQKLAAREGDIVEIPEDYPGFSSAAAVGDGTSGPEELRRLAAPYVYSPQDGRVVGRHEGAHFYTVGQRKGLGVGGRPQPLFVIGTDVERNIVYVGQGPEHPGLYRRALRVLPQDMHWVRPDRALRAGDSRRVRARIRYRQPLRDARLFVNGEGGWLVFDEPQRGVAPGQFAAWYEGDELTGSGTIDR